MPSPISEVPSSPSKVLERGIHYPMSPLANQGAARKRAGSAARVFSPFPPASRPDKSSVAGKSSVPDTTTPASQRTSMLMQFPAPPTRSPTRAELQAKKKSLSIAVRPYSAATSSTQGPQSAPIGTVADSAATVARVAPAQPQPPPSQRQPPAGAPPKLTLATTQQTDADFFTSLAAQERRVLELREELAKAEQELMALKKQWVSHEVTRRRSDVPLTSGGATPSSAGFSASSASSDTARPGTSQSWLQHERDRRRSLTQPISASGRRVFSSSKSPRPLSLVSPTTVPIMRRLSDVSDGPSEVSSEASLAAASADALEAINATRSNLSDAMHPIPEEASIRSRTSSSSFAKRNAPPAPEPGPGLWTFFEDLQQAAPGDDDQPMPAPMKSKGARCISESPRSRANGRSRVSSRGPSGHRSERSHESNRDTLIEIGGVLYNHHGRSQSVAARERQASTNLQRQMSTPPQTRFFGDDPWGSWDAREVRLRQGPYPPSSRSNSSASHYHDSLSTGHTARSSSQSSVEETVPRGSSTPSRGYKPPAGKHWAKTSKQRLSMFPSSATRVVNESVRN